MAFQLSPGVNVSEVDLTNVVPAVATSIGAFAGPFKWGPVKEIRTISNESSELVPTFWKPDNETAKSFFTCANFLSYSQNLKVVRVIGASGFNATTGATGVLVENETDYVTNHSSGTSGTTWFARYPGALGNTLAVSIADSANFSGWTYASQFQSAPNTSPYAAAINANANDELHVAVIDEDGLFSGTAGTVLEKYQFVSKASDAKNEVGETNFYKNVINNKSKYVWWGNHTTAVDASGVAWGSAIPGASGFAGATGPAFTESLRHGRDDNQVTSANEIAGYDLFKTDTIDVNLVMLGDAQDATITDVISNLVESRKDCVAFVSPKQADVVDNAGSEETDLITYWGTTINPNSSYVVFDCNYKYQYDKYNDLFRWIPFNGDVAGLCARTDLTNDPWWSPAGFNRGVIKNVTKLAWNPTRANRDNMYKYGINPIVSEAGAGFVLFGDKTSLAKPSAFDRINVRRLFIVLEKAIATAAKFYLFEFNDAFTRAQFVSTVEPFLREVKGRRGITDYRIVCDETNNTGAVIDANEFVGDIYIKPVRSINFIQLNFVAVKTSVEFSEIVGKF